MILAAAGKPPNFSPRRTIDEIRRQALSIPADEFTAVKGLPADWSAAFLRDDALRLIDMAEKYIMIAAVDLLGLLAVNEHRVPIEITRGNRNDCILRRATDEPEVMPLPAEFNAVSWNSSRS